MTASLTDSPYTIVSAAGVASCGAADDVAAAPMLRPGSAGAGTDVAWLDIM